MYKLKGYKKFAVMSISTIMFMCGVLISTYYYTKIKVYGDSGSNEIVAAEEPISDQLPDEEIAFLEDYVFGQWRFVEQIFSLDESENSHYNTTSNFSDIGVEELKSNVVIYLSINSIETVQGTGQNTLSNAKDFYLYFMWSGLNWSSHPQYNIQELNTDMIHLEDLYCREGHDVPLPDAENFIKVTYSLNYEGQSFSLIRYPTDGLKGRNLADVLYIDPNDIDSIYMEFCGLWRMERDNSYYGTGGKSQY